MGDVPEPKQTPKPRYKTPLLVGLLCLLLLASAGTGVYWHQAYKREVAASPERERQAMLDELKKSIDLPEGTPEIAVVKDAAKLSNPLLASKAQNGDKLLVYNQAKRVIIYRPSTKKLVDMLTISN